MGKVGRQASLVINECDEEKENRWCSWVASKVLAFLHIPREYFTRYLCKSQKGDPGTSAGIQRSRTSFVQLSSYYSWRTVGFRAKTIRVWAVDEIGSTWQGVGNQTLIED